MTSKARSSPGSTGSSRSGSPARFSFEAFYQRQRRSRQRDARMSFTRKLAIADALLRGETAEIRLVPPGDGAPFGVGQAMKEAGED